MTPVEHVKPADPAPAEPVKPSPARAPLRGRFTSAEDVKRYVLGGHGAFTIVSLRTGTRYTYRCTAARHEANNEGGRLINVDLRTGGDAWQPAGVVILPPSYAPAHVLTQVFQHGRSARALDFFLSRVVGAIDRHAPRPPVPLGAGTIPAALEVWHEGVCAKCGRALTVPSSIAAGIGPVCASR